MSHVSETVRPPSELDQLADRFVDDYAASQPTVATYIGVPGHDDRWPDLTPEGHAAHAELLRTAVGSALRIDPVDRRDEAARSAMLERLGAELARFDAGWAQADLNTIDSPLQGFRSTFDLMPTATEEDWATIARRLAAIPAALDGYAVGLEAAARAGRVSAARQVRLGAQIARRWAGSPDRSGFFTEFVAGAPARSEGLVRDLERAAQQTSGDPH